ncbi:helix-turn-helix domain-containing protein [Burkholderia gladioli]|uniref:helix-turn-helix domain-containing protein n=1 Tax=Burkholderia gladioli TaxID=28095 RepID=UPI00163DF089|nr:helix-turn-helix domain-containing protein [Burkholderia gladioli]
MITSFQFSTTDYPLHEQFDVWRDNCRILEMSRESSTDVGFDASIKAIMLGRIGITSSRTGKTTDPGSLRIVARRSQEQIRKDGEDAYHLILNLQRTEHGEAGNRRFLIYPGSVTMFDASLPLTTSVTIGECLGLIIPRNLLDHDARSLHGRTIDGVLGGLLSDHLQSLYGRYEDLSAAEEQRVTQATTHLLRACLQPSPEHIAEALPELGQLQKRRVERYIDAHLLDPTLNVDKICNGVGLSRTVLYRLFESTSGIAHLIQEKRLRLAYERLTDSTSPRPRIAALAERYGFSSDKHFSRAFKKMFGHAPRDAVSQHWTEVSTNPRTGWQSKAAANQTEWAMNAAEGC